VHLDYSAVSQPSSPHVPRPSEITGAAESAEADPLLVRLLTPQNYAPSPSAVSGGSYSRSPYHYSPNSPAPAQNLGYQTGYPPSAVSGGSYSPSPYHYSPNSPAPPQNLGYQTGYPPSAVSGGSYSPSPYHYSPNSPAPPQNLGYQVGYPHPSPSQTNPTPFSPTREPSSYSNAQRYRAPSHSTSPFVESNLPTSDLALAASGYVPPHMLNPQPFSAGDNLPHGNPPNYDEENSAAYSSYPQQGHPSSLLPS
jgi:hypothetical protein